MRPPIANVTEVRLEGALSVDYEVCWGEPGSEQRRTVRVNFPDEARAILASLPWKQGLRVVDLITEIGSAYITRSLAVRTGTGPLAGNGNGLAKLDVPHDYFHGAIRAKGFHDFSAV
jgi:hypothetical protein